MCTTYYSLANPVLCEQWQLLLMTCRDRHTYAASVGNRVHNRHELCGRGNRVTGYTLKPSLAHCSHFMSFSNDKDSLLLGVRKVQ